MQQLGVWHISSWFWKTSLLFAKAAFVGMKIHYCFPFRNIIKCHLFLRWQCIIFSIITPVLGVTERSSGIILKSWIEAFTLFFTLLYVFSQFNTKKEKKNTMYVWPIYILLDACATKELWRWGRGVFLFTFCKHC